MDVYCTLSVPCDTFRADRGRAYLAVRLRFLQVTRLCCLIAAGLVIQRSRGGWGQAIGLGGGQELYSGGNQTSLVPHGQQGIALLLPQAPSEGSSCISVVLNLLLLFIYLSDIILTTYWLFAMGWADNETKGPLLPPIFSLWRKIYTKKRVKWKRD